MAYQDRGREAERERERGQGQGKGKEKLRKNERVVASFVACVYMELLAPVSFSIRNGLVCLHTSEELHAPLASSRTPFQQPTTGFDPDPLEHPEKWTPPPPI